MNIKMLHSENLMNEVREEKDTIFSVVIFIIFLSIAGHYLLSMNVGETEIKDYAGISANPYEKYEKMMTGVGIKSIIENKQFKEYKYNDKLDSLIQKSSPNIRNNLFNETF